MREVHRRTRTASFSLTGGRGRLIIRPNRPRRLRFAGFVRQLTDRVLTKRELWLCPNPSRFAPGKCSMLMALIAIFWKPLPADSATHPETSLAIYLPTHLGTWTRARLCRR